VMRVSTANAYDKYGRVTATYTYDPTMPADSLKMLAVETEYDLGGKVTRTAKYPYGVNAGGISRKIEERYTYDRLGRVDSVFSKNGGADEVLLATYAYYPTGSVKTVNMGNSLTISYTYHISGALKTAKVETANGGELYSEMLHYEDCGDNECEPQYNGNISYMVQRIAHNNRDFVQIRDVAYYYDQLNRLTKTDDLSQDYFDDIFEYDAQGRITAQRRAYRADSIQGGEYVYYDSTNRLKSVAEGMGGTGDGRDMSAGDNFVYDRDGNLVEDRSKGLKISYDWRGMPIEFIQEPQPTGSSSDTARLSMMYDGSGRRISKTFLTKSATAASWDTVKVTHYTGIGTEIREEFHNGTRENVNIVVNMPEGLGRYRVADASQPADDNASRTFEWYLKNHLGSTMLVYGTVVSTDPNTADIGETKAAYDYRAFGEMVTLTQPSDKVTENFTGKEHDEEIKLDYFGARYLDPMLGLWISVDNARQFDSPYLYVGNRFNPINAMDSDGNVTVGAEFRVSGATPGFVSASGGATVSIMLDFDRLLSGKWPLLYSVSGEVGGGAGGGGGLSIGLFASSDSPKLGAYEQRRYDVNLIAGGGVGVSLSPGDGGRYDASLSIGGGAEAYVGGSFEFGYIGEFHPDNKLQDMIERPEDYPE